MPIVLVRKIIIAGVLSYLTFCATIILTTITGPHLEIYMILIIGLCTTLLNILAIIVMWPTPGREK